MAEPDAAPPLTWNRWLPGSSVLAFLFLSAALWTACLLAWEVRQAVLVVVLLAVGAFAPILWLGIRLRTRPLWALRIRGDRDAIAAAVRDAIRDRIPTQLTPSEAGAEGVFRRCETVLRIDEPACLLGIQRGSGEPGTTLLLLPRARGRRATDALRRIIAARLAAP